MARHVRAVPDASATLTPAEAKTVDDLRISTRSPKWIGRLMQAFREASDIVTRSEFDRVCLKVVAELEGQTMHPDDAAAKAKRLVVAYTRAHAGAMCPKCDYSNTAVLVIWLGHPQSGFLFSKAFTLKDPAGNKHAPA